MRRVRRGRERERMSSETGVATARDRRRARDTSDERVASETRAVTRFALLSSWCLFEGSALSASRRYHMVDN